MDLWNLELSPKDFPDFGYGLGERPADLFSVRSIHLVASVRKLCDYFL